MERDPHDLDQDNQSSAPPSPFPAKSHRGEHSNRHFCDFPSLVRTWPHGPMSLSQPQLEGV
jgi:hypothetical protein